MLDALGEPFVDKTNWPVRTGRGPSTLWSLNDTLTDRKITFRPLRLRETQVPWVVKQSDGRRLAEKMLPSEQLELRGCEESLRLVPSLSAAGADGSSLGERRFS